MQENILEHNIKEFSCEFSVLIAEEKASKIKAKFHMDDMRHSDKHVTRRTQERHLHSKIPQLSEFCFIDT